MGKKVTIEYEDDLDGGSIDAEVVDTVNFSYRGNDYTLILTAENGAQFDADIARYISAAKKAQARETRQSRAKKAPAPTVRKSVAAVKKAQPARARVAKPARAAQTKQRRGPKSATVASATDQNRAIRQWAVANGHPVSKRGRIAADVIEAFNAAH